MINVVGLTNKSGNWIDGDGWSGCGYHRVLLPLATMTNVNGMVTDILEQNTKIDILLYNRLSQYDGRWDEVKLILNCKVVMDIDDYWVLPPNHILHYDYERVKGRIEDNIRKADLITVTNEYLAEKVRLLNSSVSILPNGLPFGKMQFIDGRLLSDKVRIFWAGGTTHEHDLSILKNPFSRLLQHKNKIQMVIAGYDTDNKIIWDRMVSSFTVGGKLDSLILPSMSTRSYMGLYENADIMVIPLEETTWHSGKSNLKILEAASKRIPCIVSNVAPYNQDKDAPVLWVSSQKDWFKHLNYLILNPEKRISLGNDLYEWAKSKYGIDTINEKRYKAFNQLVNGQEI